MAAVRSDGSKVERQQGRKGLSATEVRCCELDPLRPLSTGRSEGGKVRYASRLTRSLWKSSSQLALVASSGSEWKWIGGRLWSDGCHRLMS